MSFQILNHFNYWNKKYIKAGRDPSELDLILVMTLSWLKCSGTQWARNDLIMLQTIQKIIIILA